jgi:CRP-like cAMP-binding protein
LLASLSAADWDIISPLLQLVELRPRQTIHHARMPMDHVYFPERGLVSVSARIAPDQWVEVWLVGSEGMTGVPVVLGDSREPALRRVVQVGGTALRMASGELMRVMAESRSIEGLFRRYIEVVLLQTAQSGACNAHHSLKQRLARWLLLARSGLQDDVLPLTHNVMSRLLGVRRPSVTECLGVLQAQGAILMSRGEIRITDPTSLENICCHCHQVIKHEYQRLVTNHRHNTSKK